MALTWNTKRSIDFAVPVAAAAGVAVLTFKQKKDTKFVVVAALITLVLGYLLTTQLTKMLYLKGPAPVPTGPGAEGYDPKPLIDAIYDDIECTLCLRKQSLYNTLLTLTDAEFKKAYNHWNANYYSKNNETLAQAIANESHFFDSDFRTLKEALSKRFAKFNLS